MENSWRGGPGQGREEPGEEQPGAALPLGVPALPCSPHCRDQTQAPGKAPWEGRLWGGSVQEAKQHPLAEAVSSQI